MVCVNILTNRSERAWIDHRKRDNCRTKASPVQGEVSAEQADGGDVAERCYDFALDYGEYEGRTAHPLSQKSKIFASSPYTGEPFVAFLLPLCYNIPMKARKTYDKSVIRMPRQDSSQARHTKLYNAIPPFATG